MGQRKLKVKTVWTPTVAEAPEDEPKWDVRLVLSLKGSTPGMRRVVLFQSGADGGERRERIVPEDSDPLSKHRELSGANLVIFRGGGGRYWAEIDDLFRDVPATPLPEAKANA